MLSAGTEVLVLFLDLRRQGLECRNRENLTPLPNLEGLTYWNSYPVAVNQIRSSIASVRTRNTCRRFSVGVCIKTHASERIIPSTLPFYPRTPLRPRKPVFSLPLRMMEKEKSCRLPLYTSAHHTGLTFMYYQLWVPRLPLLTENSPSSAMEDSPQRRCTHISTNRR